MSSVNLNSESFDRAAHTLARLYGMQAMNDLRRWQGQSPEYDESAFYNV